MPGGGIRHAARHISAVARAAYLGCGCARSLGPAVSPVVLFRLGPYAAFIVPPFGPPFLSPAPVPVACGCSPGSRANLYGPLGASYVRCPRVSCSSPGPVRRPGRSRRGRRPAARAPAPSRPAPGPRAPSPALPGSSARRRFRGAFAASRARLRRAELVRVPHPWHAGGRPRRWRPLRSRTRPCAGPPRAPPFAAIGGGVELPGLHACGCGIGQSPSKRLCCLFSPRLARPSWNRRPNRSRVYRSFTRSVKLFSCFMAIKGE